MSRPGLWDAPMHFGLGSHQYANIPMVEVIAGLISWIVLGEHQPRRVSDCSTAQFRPHDYPRRCRDNLRRSSFNVSTIRHDCSVHRCVQFVLQGSGSSSWFHPSRRDREDDGRTVRITRVSSRVLRRQVGTSMLMLHEEHTLVYSHAVAVSHRPRLLTP